MTIQTELYDSMVADIVTLTNRPDLVAEAQIAMRTATTNAHLTDIYIRDVVSDQVQLPNAIGTVGLDINTLFPGFRGLIEVLPLDVNQRILTPNDWNKIEIVELGDIYDPEYGNLRNQIAYASGDKIVIRYPMNVWGFAVSWAKAPQTQRALYNSWIAQMAPAIITFWGAAILLNTDGNEEKARSYLTQVEKVYIPQLKSNFLTSAMR